MGRPFSAAVNGDITRYPELYHFERDREAQGESQHSRFRNEASKLLVPTDLVTIATN